MEKCPHASKSSFSPILASRHLGQTLSKICQTRPQNRSKSSDSALIVSTFPKFFIEYKIENEKPELKSKKITHIVYQCQSPKPKTANNTRYFIKEDPYNLLEIQKKGLEEPSKVIEKHFKIKSSSSKSHNTHGKMIDVQMVKEISEKERFLGKLESKRKGLNYMLSANFNSQIYVKSFIKKVKKIHSLDLQNSYFHAEDNFSEDNFFRMISSFYSHKLIKCGDLMKYFIGKDTFSTMTRIGKFLFLNLSVPVENNMVSLEYLENIHRKLNITDADYNVYKGLFSINMRENGFSESNVQTIMVRFEKYRGFIVRNTKIEHLCPYYKGNLETYITSVHDEIKENGILGAFFSQITDKNAIFHHKRLFHNISHGPLHYSLMTKKIIQTKEKHCQIGLDWRECFEMKNILYNNLILEKKDLAETKDLELFHQNLQHLHKYILNEPNAYSYLEGSIDPTLLRDEFTRNLSKTNNLHTIFNNWTSEKVAEHNKYLVNYMLKLKENPYNLEDLIPAHCKAFITTKDFNLMKKAFHSSLIQIKVKDDNLKKIMLEFEQTRYNISREKTLLDKIGGLGSINTFIDIIYVFLFGSEETKSYFVNSDIEYVKFKQKLFFAKIFSGKINHVDLIDLKAIHYKMGVTSEAFEIFANFCQIGLMDLKLKEPIVDAIMEKIKSLKSFICEIN